MTARSQANIISETVTYGYTLRSAAGVPIISEGNYPDRDEAIHRANKAAEYEQTLFNRPGGLTAEITESTTTVVVDATITY